MLLLMDKLNHKYMINSLYTVISLKQINKAVHDGVIVGHGEAATSP